MKPGHEMDALIHKEVFGLCDHEWRDPDSRVGAQCTRCKAQSAFTAVQETPAYSGSMAAAWVVVEKLRLEGRLISLSPHSSGMWLVCDAKALNPRGDGTADGFDDTVPESRFWVESPAHGVCLAALEWALPEEAIAPYLFDCLYCGRDRLHHGRECPTRREE